MRLQTFLGYRLLAATLIISQGVWAQNCTSFTIRTAEDLKAARRCPEVFGDVIIGTELSHVNLDGIETIHGNFETLAICRGERPGCNLDWPLDTISSTTLTTVGGRLLMSWSGGLRNITLPKLRAVGRQFNLHTVPRLAYLDISLLESVGRFKIDAQNLTTMRHEGLRNLTGEGHTVKEIILSVGLETIDSVLKYPLSVDQVYLYLNPRVKKVNFGLANTTQLLIYTNVTLGNRFQAIDGSTTVVVGGPETKTMHVREFYCQNATVELERLPSLGMLTVNEFRMDGSGHLEKLALPFDELRDLIIQETETLRWLSNSPQATRWANFSITIPSDNKALNLSSEYLADESGKMVRSWYWPQKDIQYVNINAILGDGFL
ncbi:uncharacterized protein CTRU02_208262 [Colletotrichum truncatum]|uniref:Uncharacterized protein n=1 Tax=Colletotrichum truncatum TaxID=5467 RepID=A0ACC3YYR6_COLTU|nr:uncharacterized protein CTRU02_07559 [Colletotrichum truncatum]KAF6791219.1 hypothetical protein CTRU02_07559 [Colletotrichum truncatum]